MEKRKRSLNQTKKLKHNFTNNRDKLLEKELWGNNQKSSLLNPDISYKLTDKDSLLSHQLTSRENKIQRPQIRTNKNIKISKPNSKKPSKSRGKGLKSKSRFSTLHLENIGHTERAK